MFEIIKRRMRALNLDRFDLIVLGVMLALIVAIGGVVLAGDQVGVTIARNGYAPVGAVSGAESIRVRFSDDMSPASVEAHFHIEPEVAGTFAWTGQHTLTFTPDLPLLAGQTYTVTIQGGAQAARRGSSLHQDFGWTFSVRLPRPVYIAPSDQADQHLYMTDLETGDVFQLTTHAQGSIEDFAVSPNGSRIAYSLNGPGGTTDIWVLDLNTHTTRQVTNCVNARCTAPAWKPDGTQLAYQREDFNTGLQTGMSRSRAWIVDLNTLATQLLFADSQILGKDPTWSPTGRRIAVYDSTLPGIRIHDYTAQSDTLIENLEDVVGRFSPDGQKLVYPVLVRGLLSEQAYTHLEMVDFETTTRTRLSGEQNTPVADNVAAWSPDGQTLLILRRYLDQDRFTIGNQLYLLDVASGEAQPLVVDGAYRHGAAHWDPAGTRIVFQRYPEFAQGARPEIWTYDLETGELTQIATNAFLPGWVP